MHKPTKQHLQCCCTGSINFVFNNLSRLFVAPARAPKLRTPSVSLVSAAKAFLQPNNTCGIDHVFLTMVILICLYRATGRSRPMTTAACAVHTTSGSWMCTGCYRYTGLWTSSCHMTGHVALPILATKPSCSEQSRFCRKR